MATNDINKWQSGQDSFGYAAWTGHSALGVNLNRQQNAPLDISCEFKNIKDMLYYVTEGRYPVSGAGVSSEVVSMKKYPYLGQVIALVDVDPEAVSLYYIKTAASPTFTGATDTQIFEHYFEEVGRATVGDDKSIHLDAENGVLSIKNYGVAYYAYDTTTKTYSKQVVDTEHPWKAGLEPRVVSESGELVIGWYEPNPTTVEGLDARITTAESNITALQGLHATGKTVAQEVSDGIATLDVTVSGMGAGKTLASLTETDGKIAATFQDISITASQISDGTSTFKALQDAVDSGEVAANTYVARVQQDAQGKVTITKGNVDLSSKQDVLGFEGTYSKTTNKVVTKSALDTAVSAEETRATGVESGLDSRIGAIEDDYLKAADKTELSTAISNEATARSTADTTLGNRISTIEGDYLKAADKTELAEDIANEETRATGIEAGLAERIENLEARGRFLSAWNAVTGKPATDPTTLPYQLKAGDYFIVATIAAAEGETNKQPEAKTVSGKTGYYYTGEASVTAESRELGIGDYYTFDGTKYVLVQNSQKTVNFKDIAGEATSNVSLNTELGKKVDKVAGKSLVSDTEITKLAGVSTGANKVEATAKSGKISIDGTEVQIVADNTVTDANYKHITVTSTSVSDGTNTFNKYDDTALAGRVTTAESDITALEGRADGHDTDISGLKTRMTSAESDITSLKTTVGDSSSGLVKGLADEITARTNADSALDTRIKAFEASGAHDVAALETRVGTAEGKVTALENKTAGDFTVGTGATATTDIKHYVDDKDSKKADKVASATSGNFAGLDANGNLTDSGKKAADFATAAQGTKADSAIQTVKVNGTALTATNNAVNVTIAEGSTNGTIAANGADVAVHGLGSAAYTNSTAYATAAQGALADSAVQSLTVLGQTLDKSHTSLTVDTAKTALGLGSAAYEDITVFDAAGSATTAVNTLRGGYTGTVKDVNDGLTATNATVSGHTSAINTLNGDASTTGSVAKAVADAKTELKGTYASATKDDATIAGAKKYADDVAAGAIAGLDVTVTGMGAGKTLKTLTQTDGKIAATFEDISIAASQISDGATTFKSKQTAVDSGAAATNTFVSRVEQNANGEVTITKGTVDLSSKQDIFTDGTATVATVSNGVVTIKNTVTQDKGTIKTDETSTDDITLKKVATTGAAADVTYNDDTYVVSADTVQQAIDYTVGLVLNTPQLDDSSKIPIEYFPDIVLGNVLFGGTISSSTSLTPSANCSSKIGYTPTSLVNQENGDDGALGYSQSGNAEGIYFIATADYSFAGISFKVGDWIISTGTAWKKVKNTDAVTGVKGDAEDTYRIGEVNITKANIGLGNVNNTSDADKPVSTAQQTALDAKVNKTTTIAGVDLQDNITKAELLTAINVADGAQVNVIESLSVNGTAATISDKAATVTLPAATASALGLVKVDNTSIEAAADGTIGVKAVNVNKLFIAEGDELVLNGGNA